MFTLIKIVPFLTIMVQISNCHGQASEEETSRWYKGYSSQTWTASDVNNLIDLVGYKSYLRKDVDTKMLKTIFLQFSPQIYIQLNDESAYLCSAKHDDYFAIWNMYHPKLDKAFWDKNCKGLIILLRIDNIAKMD